MATRTGLRPEDRIGEALAAVAADILADARGAIEAEDRSDAVAIHDFRKAMKRWRAFLRLLEPTIGEEARALRTAARDLARELASARDSQSALDALTDLDKAESVPSPRSLATMRERLQAMREAAETKTLTPPLRRRLTGALDTAGHQVEAWPLDRTAFSDIATGLATAYGRARQAIPRSWAKADAEELHELRQRVVVHRYQMELIAPLWPRLSKLWIGEAQRLRERLGTCQDLSVLAALAARGQPLAHWRARLDAAIGERHAVHVRAAARMAGRLFSEKPKAFQRRMEALWRAGDEEAGERQRRGSDIG
ncbi:MAG: CHAD domain-containing protein [Variibacter sp.]